MGPWRNPNNFDELLRLSADDLRLCDIALVNLLCATGLPGSERLDLAGCLTALERWAVEVHQETERNFRFFTPKTARDTPGFLRCWTLCKVLRHKRELRHHLTPPDATPTKRYVGMGCVEPGPKSSYRSSEPIFLHGLLGPRKIGSCTSFPVLFAAVGRRLGYPIKLVLTVRHVFIRWDDPNDAFNMDSSEFHINRHPDDYYINWPKPWTDAEKRCGAYLRPITATRELGLFLGMRAACLHANHRWSEALANCELAQRLSPLDPLYHGLARQITYDRVRLGSNVIRPTGDRIAPEKASFPIATINCFPTVPLSLLHGRSS